MKNFQLVFSLLRGCTSNVSLVRVPSLGLSFKRQRHTDSPNYEMGKGVTVTDNLEEDRQYEEDIKTAILNNALKYVNERGWSIEALAAGAEANGYPGVTHGLFPNGGADLIQHFNVISNLELTEIMKKWPKENQTAAVPVKFLENAITSRIFMTQPYKSTWSQAIAIQTLPTNFSNSLNTFLSLIDDICYYSGDRSVDFNWYTRRAGIAGIYKSAELYYLTDKSENCVDTKKFVSARIKDAEFLQNVFCMNPFVIAPEALSVAFVTAKNILGINSVKQ